MRFNQNAAITTELLGSVPAKCNIDLSLTYGKAYPFYFTASKHILGVCSFTYRKARPFYLTASKQISGVCSFTNRKLSPSFLTLFNISSLFIILPPNKMINFIIIYLHQTIIVTVLIILITHLLISLPVLKPIFLHNYKSSSIPYTVYFTIVKRRFSNKNNIKI